jgi:hypothetical protein
MTKMINHNIDLDNIINNAIKDNTNKFIKKAKAIEDGIIEPKKLKESSKNIYDNNYKKLTEIIEKPMEWIAMNPDKTYEILKSVKHYKNNKDGELYAVSTINHNIKAILTWIRENYPKDKRDTILQEAHFKYKELFMITAIEVTKINETHELNENKEKAAVSYKDFIETRDKLAKLDPYSQEYLLLCMYSYIAPVRQDYNYVKLYNNILPPDDLKDNTNYIIMNNDDMVLFLYEFKNNDKHFYEPLKLPIELTTIIKKQLKCIPRDYLFTKKNREPYIFSNSYTQWVNRVLCRLFNKEKLTINIIRDIMITEKTKNMSDDEKIKFAKQCCHSYRTQQLLYCKKNIPIS